MNLRLFIALELPESFLRDLELDLEGLKKAHPEFRWIKRENQHLTLAFLGSVPEDRIPIVLSAMEQAMSPWQRETDTSQGISVSAQGLYTFPPRKPASVLAVGLSTGKETVCSLAAALETELVAIKETAQLVEFQGSRRPFTPHITVARAGRSPIRLAEMERQLPLQAQGSIGYATLYSSLLQRGGPVYTVQGRFHL